MKTTHLFSFGLVFQPCHINENHTVCNLKRLASLLSVMSLQGIDAATCIISLFLFLRTSISISNILLYKMTPACHSFVEEYVGCFQFGSVMDSSALHIHVQIFV